MEVVGEEKKTSLYDEHIKLEAKMVPFGGWNMPVQYEGIIKEHNATREFAGLFDVSHMGEVYIKGIESLEFLQSIVPQDISTLNEGCAVYCQLPNKDGGLIDDLIIYNVKNLEIDADYFIVINASRIEVDIPFMIEEAKKFAVEVINKSDDFSMLALQGPNAKYIIDKLATEELQKEIENMAEEIIDKQNEKLDSYRKEGHLYMVSEELGNNRFLYDLTDSPDFEFEEVNIPKDLLDVATEGSVLKYTNGTYEYYSSDGFERLDKINSSKYM